MNEKQRIKIRVPGPVGNGELQEIYNDFASNINLEWGWSDRVGRLHPRIRVSKDGNTWMEVGSLITGTIEINESYTED
jgi:hypothetical protein